ncbi:hypothetical protein, partial [Caballeronia sp. INML3]|uniref:hypothetical protein n=1 Tax=Caballeronia sp. INML3 TaxID=2921752 RepID=UPI002032A0EE
QMKQERPEAFHIEHGVHETLSQRHFAYEPKTSLPMAGFKVSCTNASEALRPAVRRSAARQEKR